MIIGILFLCSFVINGAMTGPITVSLPAKSPLIKGMWRSQATAILTYPLLLLFYLLKGKNASITKDFSPKMIVNIMITCIFDMGWYLGLIVGCSMTISSHAMVMYSSTGVFMFAFAVVTRVAVHKYEVVGYSMFALGVILMFTDPYAIKVDGIGSQYLGDLIAFLGAGSGAIVGILNSTNTKLMHPLVLMSQLLTISVVYQTAFCCFMLGPDKVLSFDPGYGVFGWMSDSSTAVYLMGIVAPFNGLTSNFSFYISYYFFPLEIIAGAILTEPFIAQIVSVAFGQDQMPGFKTILGLTIITFGTLVSSYGSRLKALRMIEKICEESLLMFSKISMTQINNKKGTNNNRE
jgi:hypothetical protein